MSVAELWWRLGLFSKHSLMHHRMKMESKGGKRKRLKLERILNLGFEVSWMQAKEGASIVHITGTSWMLLRRIVAQEKPDLW